MDRQRLLALLEVYDTAIEELYVLGDRGFLDLILRLERRRQDAAAQLPPPHSQVSREDTLEIAPVVVNYEPRPIHSSTPS